LWRGANGNAGMLGIQFPTDRPRPSGQDLFAHMLAAGVAVDDFPDLEQLSPNGCPPLALWIRRAGRQLREQLSITARLLDPHAIVIGGRLPTHILRALTAEIDQPDFCEEGMGFAKPRLIASQLGPKSGVIGAACLPILNSYFREEA
jgi:predicted NBD/HSP70 family sugar kinase